MIAMACDYRIMTSHASTTIGLNEAKFGIVAPAFMGQLMIQTIGYRQAEKALSLGTIFTSQEALDIGLVDQVVAAPAADSLLDTCHSVALEWAKIPSKARVASKHMARKGLMDTFTTSRHEDLQFFREYIMTESVQQGLGKYLESIKRKK
jgi:3,2-trans-enoyl-CoA isomerase